MIISIVLLAKTETKDHFSKAYFILVIKTKTKIYFVASYCNSVLWCIRFVIPIMCFDS